jgi:hypothetical protein
MTLVHVFWTWNHQVDSPTSSILRKWTENPLRPDADIFVDFGFGLRPLMTSQVEEEAGYETVGTFAGCRLISPAMQYVTYIRSVCPDGQTVLNFSCNRRGDV